MKKNKKIIILLVIMQLALTSILFSGCEFNKKENKEANEAENLLKEEQLTDEFSDIRGGWQSTATGGSYYVFNSDNTYYWYKSSSDLNDNYYKGEMEILRGSEAMDDLGISYDNLLTVIANSEGTVTLEDIYSIKLHPTYLISNKIDKTSTLTSEFDRKLLFVYVSDSEAQAIDTSTGDAYYFEKYDIQ